MSSRGFTLVETLVAVTILLMVVIGPMTIASKGMQSAYFAGDQTTAIYLAQEAIEHIQRLRDDDALAEYREYSGNGSSDNDTRSWYSSLDSDCKDSDGCDVEYGANTYVYRDCSLASNCLLNKYWGATPGDRVYGYETGSDWSPSIYTRRVRVGTLNDGGVPVTVTVSWNSSLFSSTRTVILQTYVYDNYARFE